MWLRNVFLKTLRDCRVAIIGWGIGMGALVPLFFAGFSVFLASPVGREEILQLTRNPVMRLFAEAVQVDSPGGYATWRLSLLLPMLAIWALLAVSRVTRGEEESGAFDLLLSVSGSRSRLVVAKLAALAAALVLIGTLMALLAFAGARLVHADLAWHRAALFGLNTTLFALAFGALTFLVSQFTRERRSAAGATGILLGVSFVLTSAGRVMPGGEWIGRLSPLYYFELNKPLVNGHPLNVGGLLAMSAVAVVATVMGLVLFVNRDLGASGIMFERDLFRRPPPRPLPMLAWSLRSRWARNVRDVIGSAVWWGTALALYASLLTTLLPQVQQDLDALLADVARGNPVIAGVIQQFIRGGVETNMAFLSAVFGLLVVVVAAFAVSLANRWASDEEQGRLDLLLAMPNPRYSVMLTCFAACALGLTIVTGFIFAGTTLASAAVGFDLDIERVAEAAFGMIPVGLVVGSLGYLLSGWLSTHATTGVLIAFVLVSFVLTLLVALFRWPPVLLQLSVFEHYGTPLIDGVARGRVFALLGVAAVTLAAAVVRFESKDLIR